jgi:hypothetical protein
MDAEARYVAPTVVRLLDASRAGADCPLMQVRDPGGACTMGPSRWGADPAREPPPTWRIVCGGLSKGDLPMGGLSDAR